MVNVYNENGQVVSRVKYNSNLDYWNGSNWTSGGIGCHKGITKLKNGLYVLIYGTDWQGEKDYAEIITKEEALQEILKSGNNDILDESKFSELKRLYQNSMLEEA